MERFSIWNAAGFSLLLGASGTPEGLLEQPQALERAKRNWNNLELSGTIWNAAGF